jgi:putative ATP-binding cassette transporter
VHVVLPYWGGRSRPVKWLALLALVAMVLGQTWTHTLLASWSKDFYNATIARQSDRLVELALLAGGFILLLAALQASRLWIDQWLSLDWRQVVTHRVVDRWLAKRSFHRLEVTSSVDNPDQRIESEIGGYTTYALALTLDALAALVSIVTFTVLVWQKGGSLPLTIGDSAFELQGYLVMLAWVWAVMHVSLVHWVGKPMIDADFKRQQAGADFRFGMTRIRQGAQEIALYGGERAEQQRLLQLFDQVRLRSLRYFWLNARQVMANGTLVQTALLMPTVVVVPAILAHRMSYGESLEVGVLFGQLVMSLVWIAMSYSAFASWATTGRRVAGLVIAVEAEPPEGGIRRVEADTACLAVRDLVLKQPGGQALLPAALSFELQAGQRCLITGPSGVGKSTLLRAIVGLSDLGDGEVALAQRAKLLFLPQRPYMPPGTIKDAVCYPKPAAEFTDAACTRLLNDCRLPALAKQLHEADDWGRILSPGEQQRLSFARVLLHEPDLLFLDEATSALDEPTEAHLYALLLQRLPHCAVLSVGHRASLKSFHHSTLHLNPAEPS